MYKHMKIYHLICDTVVYIYMCENRCVSIYEKRPIILHIHIQFCPQIQDTLVYIYMYMKRDVYMKRDPLYMYI